MKNLILIIGTAKKEAENMYNYSIDIFAEKKGENLQFLYSVNYTFGGYNQMVEAVKNIVSNHFADESFKDGYHTIYNAQVRTKEGVNHKLESIKP